MEDAETNSPEADGNSEGFAHNGNQVIESAEGNADADADVEDAATSHMDIYLKYMMYREKYQVYLDVEKAKTYTVNQFHYFFFLLPVCELVVILRI